MKYEQFAQQTLAFFKEKYGVSVFFESNWTYGLTRRWQPIIESLDIRHVCILKEGLPVSTYHKTLENNQNLLESYGGSLIFFINRTYAQLHLKLGFVNEAQVCVSGMARFDELIAIGKSRAVETEMAPQDSVKRKSVVFFVPDPPPIGGEAELEAHLERRIQECVRDVILVAKETPDLDFIVKTKVTAASTEFINTLMSSWSREIPYNLRHHSGGLAKETLVNALLAIGFQTTALLDALALRVPIATPRTFYSFDGSPESILDLSSLSNLFSDGHELKSIIEKFRKENQRRDYFSVLESQIDEVLIRTVGNCDASSRSKILSRLGDLIKDVSNA